MIRHLILIIEDVKGLLIVRVQEDRLLVGSAPLYLF
jgi:hypothetical protein